MSYDSYGFSCSALHFVQLLQSPGFSGFVKEVAEVDAAYKEEAKAADLADSYVEGKRKKLNDVTPAAAGGTPYEEEDD